MTLTRDRSGIAGMAAVVCVAAATAGVGGGVLAYLAARPAAEPVAVTVPASADEVRAATIALCNGYVTGYAAIPDTQRGAADLMPTISYIDDALHANPAADPQIVAAVTDSLRLLRHNTAWLSQVAAKGAIQPPAAAREREGRVADQHVFDLCRDYGS